MSQGVRDVRRLYRCCTGTARERVDGGVVGYTTCPQVAGDAVKGFDRAVDRVRGARMRDLFSSHCVLLVSEGECHRRDGTLFDVIQARVRGGQVAIAHCEGDVT